MTRKPTVEWQVCGVCNYDCSYCIQSKKYRQGHPSPGDVSRFLDFFEALPGLWEIKTTGGEPFAFKGFIERIVPGLVARSPHTLSTLTNLSAPWPILERFAKLTYGRLGIVSASLHLEFTTVDAFVEKASRLREVIADDARLVVNAVLAPGKLGEITRAKEAVTRAGLPFFPQVMKVKGGVHAYDDVDRPAVSHLVGISPSPQKANVAPSYRGRMCWVGVEYFVLTQTGDAYACRTSKRFGEGHLGNVLDGSFALASGPLPCAYDICPCTVPANRGMIEGIGRAREAAAE